MLWIDSDPDWANLFNPSSDIERPSKTEPKGFTIKPVKPKILSDEVQIFFIFLIFQFWV